MLIPTKTDFLRLWKAGSLGNRLQAWETYDDLVTSNYRGRVGIRGRAADVRFMHYAIPFDEVRDRIKQITQSTRYTERDLYFGEAAPDDRLTIQGEFTHSQSSSGAITLNSLTYSTLQVPMRRALADGAIHVDGVSALVIMRSHFDGASWDNLQELRENYPDATIEFGCYEIPLGDRNQNTIIWEVRDY